MKQPYISGRKLLSILLVISLLPSGGCSFYRVKTRPFPESTDVSRQAGDSRKYIILHAGEDAAHLKNITLNAEGSAMSGELEELPPEHRMYQVQRRRPGPRRYKPAKSDPTHEVHIYLTDSAALTTGETTTIPLAGIRKIDIYDKDVAATVASYAGVTLAVVGGVVVIIGIVAFATKSSCPFVFVRDGAAGWRFAGEMYGGAIYAPLERDDYMPLPGFSPADGVYTLKIANDLQERQYTNIAELIVADHPAGTTVLADAAGQLRTIARPQPPVTAISGQGGNHTARMAARDSSVYQFDEGDRDNPAVSSLTLSFPKPAAATTGKLVLHARNSFWLDYMFGQFTALFGTRYNAFAASQKSVPAAQSRQWSLDQSIPLAVSVATDGGWKPCGYFETIGPLAGRDLVAAIDLSAVSGDAVRIRLQCGTMFWELDDAAMDFSADIPITTQRVRATTATDETGGDVRNSIAATDGQYLVQPQPGNAVVATFAVPPPAPGLQRTVFFHSRGYYEYVRNYTTKPDLLYLASFKKKGAFTRFAHQQYRAQLRQRDFFTTALNN